MLCSASLSSLRSAGFQPAWRPGWPPSQAGSPPRRGALPGGEPPHPLPGRLVPASVFPDERGLARLQLIVKRASRVCPAHQEDGAWDAPYGSGAPVTPLAQCSDWRSSALKAYMQIDLVVRKSRGVGNSTALLFEFDQAETGEHGKVLTHVFNVTAYLPGQLAHRLGCMFGNSPQESQTFRRECPA